MLGFLINSITSALAGLAKQVADSGPTQASHDQNNPVPRRTCGVCCISIPTGSQVCPYCRDKYGSQIRLARRLEKFMRKLGFLQVKCTLQYLHSDYYPDGTSAITPVNMRRNTFAIYGTSVYDDPIGYISCNDAVTTVQSNGRLTKEPENEKPTQEDEIRY